MKKYKHLFFDLDHTLWDYDTNVKESLSEIFEYFLLIEKGIPSNEAFVKAFYEINFDLWALYDLGKVNKDELKEMRFKRIFERAGGLISDIPKELEEEFMLRTSSKPHLLPYSIEILDYLKPNYGLHIITNGFNESQSRKMEASGLTPYFDLVITSETTGHKKPDAKIFQYAMDQLSAKPEQVIMIGDNPNSDILGAINSNIDNVYFDPHEKGIEHLPTYTIRHLKELEDLL